MKESRGSFESPATQAPSKVSIEEAPVDVASMSDDEIFKAMQDAEELEKKAEREKTIARLVEYFGDRELHYKTHSGTILQVLDLCPPIKLALDMGVDYIIAWIEEETRKALEEKNKEDDKDDTKTINETEVESEESKNPNDVSDKKVEKRDEKVEKPKKIVEKKEPYKTVERPKPTAKKDEVIEKKQVVKKEMPERKPKQNIIKAKKSEVIEEKPISKTEQTEQKVEQMNVEKEPEVPPVRFEEEGEVLAIEHKEELPKVSVIERVLDEEVATNFEEDFQNESIEMLNVEPEVGFEIESQSENETAPVVVTFPELIETWTELAKEEPTLDQLITTMATDLLKRHTESVEAVLVPPTFEVEELDEEEVSPELYALYTAVASAKKTMDQLYKATTQQECQECVDQLAVELTVILRSLGYENPEKIVREYMYTHPTDLLRELIYKLEYALRRRIYQEIQFATVNPQPVVQRHAQLSKVASFIMRLLLPQEQLA